MNARGNQIVRRLIIRMMVVVVAVVGTGCTKTPMGAVPGKPAGDFRLDTLTHERFYLNQYRGKVVLLIFWTTWCSQCKKEIVELKRILDKRNDSVVVGAICSDPENMNALKGIVAGWDISWPVLLDHNAGLFKKYRLRGYPTTLVVGRDGTVEMVRNGYSPLIMKQITAKLDALLMQTKDG